MQIQCTILCARLALGIAALASVSLVQAPALAQSAADKATARNLATAGIKLYQQQKFEEALDKLKRAQELYDAPVHLLYMARCYVKLNKLVEGAENGVAGIEELEQIRELVTAAGYLGRVIIDPSVVRGLEYYTGPVYEVELTFPVTNEDGQVVRFGSVAGGGRYDGLVGRFRPEPVPATGFSIGVSRLYSALKAVKSPIVDQKNELPLVVVTAMDNKSPEFMPAYQAFVAQLRQAKDGEGRALCRADLYLGSSGMKAQMKYADRRKAPLAVIQGSVEKEKGVVQIKDLELGKRLSEKLADNAAWRTERPGQFEVPEADLVAAVKQMVDTRR